MAAAEHQQVHQQVQLSNLSNQRLRPHRRVLVVAIPLGGLHTLRSQHLAGPAMKGGSLKGGRECSGGLVSSPRSNGSARPAARTLHLVPLAPARQKRPE